MSTRTLLNQIERSGLVDKKILTKLRREVQLQGGEAVKPKAIVKYLISKGHLTEAQAETLLVAASQAALDRTKADEFSVAVPGGRDQDTDDLTNLEPSHVSPAPAKTPAGGRKASARSREEKTRVFPVEEARQFVNEVEVAIDVEETMMVDPLGAGAGGFNDPLAAPGMSGPGNMSADAQAYKSFKGKRDKSNQWQTKWLFIGFGILGVLIIACVVLVLAVGRQSSDELFAAAEQAFKTSAYGDAMEKYKKFYLTFPNHQDAGYARVREVHCMLAMPYDSKNYNEVFTVASAQLPTVSEDPKFNVLLDELGLMLTNTALSFTRQALKQQKIEDINKELARSEDAKKLVDNPSYLPTSVKNQPMVASNIEQINNNINLIRGLITKEDKYVAAKAEIEKLTESGETVQAYTIFNQLTQLYPDLAARKELRDTMIAVSVKDSSLVKAADFRSEISTGKHPLPVNQRLIYANQRGTVLSQLEGEVLPFMVEGSVYAVDIGTGQLLWQQFVGLQTQIQPRWVDAIAMKDLIVCDQRDHRIMRIDSRTGEVRWEVTIGEIFTAPTSSDGSLYVAAYSGLVLRLNAETGEQVAAVRIPKTIKVAVEKSDQGVVYVVGDDSNIYMLSGEDLACQAVYYTGHRPGEVRIPPYFMSGFLLLAFNGSGGDFCDLNVFQTGQGGTNLQRIQRIKIASGPVTLPPLRSGRLLLYASDNGDIKMLELTASEPEAPVRILIDEKFENRGNEQLFVYNQGSDLWIAGRGLLRYRVQRSLGQMSREQIMNQGDVYLAPLRRLENALYTVRRRAGTQQISVAACDPATLKEIWRSDFGGAPAGAPLATEKGITVVSALGDLYQFSELESQASFSQVPPVALASDIDLAYNFVDKLALADGRMVCLGAAGTADVLYVDPAAATVRVSRLQSPADAMACPPVVLGNDLLVSSLRGQVVRVDPASGRLVGAPFQPPLTPGEEIKWNRPAVVSEQQIVVGNGRNTVYLLSTADRNGIAKQSELTVNGELVGEMTASGNSVAGFVRSTAGDEMVRWTVGSELTAAGSAKLPGQAVAGPWAINGQWLVAVDDGAIHAYDDAGSRLWSYDLKQSRVTGVLTDPQGLTVVALERGDLVFLDRTGVVTKTVSVGRPIKHTPVWMGSQLIVSGADGTLLVVSTSRP